MSTTNHIQTSEELRERSDRRGAGCYVAGRIEKRPRVLISCEKSQAVCKAFRAVGCEAYSNDLKECSGGHPELAHQERYVSCADERPIYDWT